MRMTEGPEQRVEGLLIQTPLDIALRGDKEREKRRDKP